MVNTTATTARDWVGISVTTIDDAAALLGQYMQETGATYAVVDYADAARILAQGVRYEYGARIRTALVQRVIVKALQGRTTVGPITGAVDRGVLMTTTQAETIINARVAADRERRIRAAIAPAVGDYSTHLENRCERRPDGRSCYCATRTGIAHAAAARVIDAPSVKGCACVGFCHCRDAAATDAARAAVASHRAGVAALAADRLEVATIRAHHYARAHRAAGIVARGAARIAAGERPTATATAPRWVAGAAPTVDDLDRVRATVRRAMGTQPHGVDVLVGRESDAVGVTIFVDLERATASVTPSVEPALHSALDVVRFFLSQAGYSSGSSMVPMRSHTFGDTVRCSVTIYARPHIVGA